MRENKRKGMPKVRQLVERHEDFLKKHFEDWFDEWQLKDCNYSLTKLYSTTCWACKLGFPWHITFYRAHILPLCEGGTNDYTNLHLLCDECHKQSEYLSGKPYWSWFYDRENHSSIIIQQRLKQAARLQNLYESGDFESIPEDLLQKLHNYYDEYREGRRYNEKYAYYHEVFNPVRGM